MSLYDSILLEIEKGMLAKELRATDLLGEERKVLRQIDGKSAERYRVGFDFYSDSHIRTEMANRAEGTGYFVKAGQVARYRKVEEGLYRVIALDEQEELLAQEQQPSVAPTEKPQTRFARYLQQEPFQIFDRRRKQVHPQQPVTGLDARITSYFWPSPAVDYAATEQILQVYIDCAQALKRDLQGNAEQVLGLFAEICQWGGVRLPTQQPQVVVDNLLLAAQKSRKQAAAMNSAWTKLYAFFYPDDFVIYDSRVATALIGIAESVMSDEQLIDFKNTWPALGYVTGRGGSRPRTTRTRWNNAYTSWAAQLDANELAKDVLASLNQDGGQYSLRQLEAVLFMEGY